MIILLASHTTFCCGWYKQKRKEVASQLVAGKAKMYGRFLRATVLFSREKRGM